jgi:hypothetical protein
MKALSLLTSLLALVSTGFAQSAKPHFELANAVQPQLVAAADGRVWLVYAQPATAASPAAQTGPAHGSGHEHHDAPTEAKKHKGHGAPAGAADVFVTYSKDGGATFAAPMKVDHLPQLMLGNRRGPRIAAHGNRLTVTAVANELVALTSQDGGATWSAPVTINDVASSAHEGLHDLAASREGELFVTWLDLRNGKTELWSSASKDGGRTWAKNELLYKSPDKSICECCHPSARFDAAGNLAVMWRNSVEGSRDMWLMTRPRGAKQFTAARKLGEGTWKINGCPHDGGALVAMGDGKFGAVAQRAGEVFLFRENGGETRLGAGSKWWWRPVTAAPLYCGNKARTW